MTTTDTYAATSTGHALGDEHRLALHYRAKQAEYDATLRAVGIQQNWRVLDGGCGAGHFLPLLSQLVGANGHIDALDTAPEHIARITTLQQQNTFACPLAPTVGSVLQLPYSNDIFDAVWIANVVQYFTDAELDQCLRECLRVLKPGGLLAIKEVDATAMQFYPCDPMAMWHLIDAGRTQHTHVAGWLRGMQLPQRLRQAGCTNIRIEPTLYERRNPLAPDVRAYIRHNLCYFAQLAESLPLPADEQTQWRELGKNPDRVLDDPDFYYRTMHLLAVGRKG